MEIDFELITIAVTVGFWLFILFLIWKVPIGFSRVKDKIVLTAASLPLIYFIVVWQKNK